MPVYTVQCTLKKKAPDTKLSQFFENSTLVLEHQIKSSCNAAYLTRGDGPLVPTIHCSPCQFQCDNSKLSAIASKMIILQKELLHHGDVMDIRRAN